MDMESEHLTFLELLDGMIEATQEFIADDEITLDSDEGDQVRLIDLAVFTYMRDRFVEFYDLEEPRWSMREYAEVAVRASLAFFLAEADSGMAQRVIDVLQPLADAAGRS